MSEPTTKPGKASIGFQTNSDEFNRNLIEYIRVTRRAVGNTIRDEAWQLAKFLAMPPGNVQPSTPPQNQGQGERAVLRDIHRAIAPLTPRAVSRLYTRKPEIAKKVRRYIRERNIEGVKAIFRNTYRGPTFVRPNQFRGAHEAARDRRGRVLAKIPPHVTTDTAELREYAKGRQRGVGAARGGWTPYLLKRDRVTIRVPDWISRHVDKGSFVDRSNDGIAPSVTLINRSPWAWYRNETGRITANALRFRSRALRAKIIRALEQAKKESLR